MNDWQPLPTDPGEALLVTDEADVEVDAMRNRWRFATAEAERQWKANHGDESPLKVVQLPEIRFGAEEEA